MLVKKTSSDNNEVVVVDDDDNGKNKNDKCSSQKLAPLDIWHEQRRAICTRYASLFNIKASSSS